MATGIIVPGRRLVTQPQYAVPVNKGHWLAKDITLLLNCAVPQFNAATGKALTITAGGSGFSQRATPLGMSLYTPNGGWADVAVGQDWGVGPNTIIALCRVNSVDSSYGGLLSKDSSGTNTQFAVGRNSSFDEIYGAVDNGGAGTFSFSGSSVSALTGFNLLAFTHSGAASSAMSYYRNGPLVGTTTNLGTQPSGTGVLGLGRSRDSSASFDSDVDWIAFVRVARVLSASEIASITSSPAAIWSLLQTPTRRIWVSAAAGGTGYTQSISGSLTPAGALTKRTGKALSGSSTAAGALAKLTGKAFAGSLTGTGQLIKKTAKAFAGSVTGSGTLATMILFTASFAGSITPSGALSKMTQKALAGASTLTGAITKLTNKGLSASITLSGALNKLTTKAFAGSVTVTGALAEAYQVVKSLAGSITPTGALATAYIAFVAGVLKMLSLLGVGQ